LGVSQYNRGRKRGTGSVAGSCFCIIEAIPFWPVEKFILGRHVLNARRKSARKKSPAAEQIAVRRVGSAGEYELAHQVIDQLLAWDPSDPLGVKALGNP